MPVRRVGAGGAWPDRAMGPRDHGPRSTLLWIQPCGLVTTRPTKRSTINPCSAADPPFPRSFGPATRVTSTEDPPVIHATVDELVTSHIPLVGHLVREVLARVPGHVDRDDLTSAGLTALVQAAQGFEAERGVPFARYASTRIRGALLDELRGVDWASRSVRRTARGLDETRARSSPRAWAGCRPTPRSPRRRASRWSRCSPTARTSPAPRCCRSRLTTPAGRTPRRCRPPAPTPEQAVRARRAARPTSPRRSPSCPSGCAASSRATSWPSSRWPSSPPSSASPSRASPSCAPRRWCCCATA